MRLPAAQPGAAISDHDGQGQLTVAAHRPWMTRWTECVTIGVLRSEGIRGNKQIENRVLCAVLWKHRDNRVCSAPLHRVSAEAYVATVNHMPVVVGLAAKPFQIACRRPPRQHQARFR